MSRGNKGFANKAKSGAKATTDRWRQAVERAKGKFRKGRYVSVRLRHASSSA